MLTPGEATGAGLRCGSRIGLGSSLGKFGPGDLSSERCDFIDWIAHRRDRLSSTES